MAGPGLANISPQARLLLARMLQQAQAPDAYADPAQQTPGIPPVMTPSRPRQPLPPLALPPFQQPGQDFQNMQDKITPMPPVSPPVMPPVTAVGQAPQPQATMAAMVPQEQIGPDGLPTSGLGDLTGSAALASADRAGSVRADVAKALMEMQQNGRLPEQWKGAFSNQYGEPR